MDFSIKFDYPYIFILFCLLSGFAFAFFTYYKKKAAVSELWKYPTSVLFLLRFISVSVIAFFLLSPFVKSYFKKIEEPVIIVALDNSRSVLLNKDSTYYLNEFPGKLKSMINSLEKNFQVQVYTFGESLKQGGILSYTDRQTDYSQLTRELNDRFSGQNIGAIIIATDGLYNKGMNPLYHPSAMNAPVYTIAMGDTVPPRDIYLREIRHNNIVYQGNDFPIQLTAAATKASGHNSRLAISRAGKELYSENIAINNDDFSQSFNVFLKAETPGLQKYTVELKGIDNEISYVNNRQDIFIEVLDSRKKILLAASAPHPDISAIKKSIEKNEQYEVEVMLYDEMLAKVGLDGNKLSNYHLVVLHQLPGVQQQASSFLRVLRERKIPMLMVLGSHSQLNVFNSTDLGLQVRATGSGMNEVLPVAYENFNLFRMSDETMNVLKRLPPLHSHFASYAFTTDHHVLLNQQIGQVKTQYPLLAFLNSGDHKIAILAGEGIWKWYLHNYSIAGNHNAVNEIIGKTVQYLSLRIDTRLFRVSSDKNIFIENEPVIFEAQLYNEIYEPLPNAKISLQVQDSEGKIFDYTFREAGNHYQLNAGQMPAGNYTYNATTEIGGRQEQLSGEFIVKAIEMEYMNTVADHKLLNSWSEQSGGKMYYPAELQLIADSFSRMEDIHSIAYLQFELKELINLRILFFLIFLLLVAEWFMRKYYGRY